MQKTPWIYAAGQNSPGDLGQGNTAPGLSVTPNHPSHPGVTWVVYYKTQVGWFLCPLSLFLRCCKSHGYRVLILSLILTIL